MVFVGGFCLSAVSSRLSPPLTPWAACGLDHSEGLGHGLPVTGCMRSRHLLILASCGDLTRFQATLRFFRGERYLEVDADLASSSATSQASGTSVDVYTPPLGSSMVLPRQTRRMISSSCTATRYAVGLPFLFPADAPPAELRVYCAIRQLCSCHALALFLFYSVAQYPRPGQTHPPPLFVVTCHVVHLEKE